jgi:hypothetical protein
MKLTVLTALLFLLLSSCKKTYENAVEEAVISAITTGSWKVSSYTRGDSNLTASFNEYSFIFQNNRTVDAIRNSTVESIGSWEENPQAQTIYAQFTNAAPTLQLLNGTWSITKNSWTYVEASLTVNGELRKLRLDKE